MPFGIYIHWPYCARICPYCDFNVYKAKANKIRESGGDNLTAAILKDLTHWREMSGPRTVTSIHFGGGTPSLMRAPQMEAMITAVQTLWDVDSHVEIAIEANPNDYKAELWANWKTVGVNRVSLGIQSFDDTVLKFLGRDHDSAQARNALTASLRYFDNVSADLIFGHADQTAAAWSRDLDIVLASGAPHISAYQLTIEPGTAFAKAQARGNICDVDSDSSADLYDLTRQTLVGAGYEHYEISNFAKPSHRSRHNLCYWQGGDYVGVGPGAHGRLTQKSAHGRIRIGGTRIATVAHMTPGAYIHANADSGHGIADQETLSAQDSAEEYILMGLRISDGIDLARYEALAGAPLNLREVSTLTEQGLLHMPKAGRLAATEAGRPLLDSVVRLILTS